jgi:hypothetical protein
VRILISSPATKSRSIFCLVPDVVEFDVYGFLLRLYPSLCHLRLANSALADSALIKPMFGAASRMGKVISPVPAKLTNKMDGTFSGNLNAFLPYGPSGLGSPNNVLKIYVRS